MPTPRPGSSPREFREEHYDLYARYIAGRHADGSMYPPSPSQFRSFLLAPWSRTIFPQARTSTASLPRSR